MLYVDFAVFSRMVLTRLLWKKDGRLLPALEG